jgi:hypothetical protein
MYCLTVPAELVITVSYWIFLYPDDYTSLDTFKTSLYHVIPFGMLLVDFCLSAIVFNPKQFIFIFIMAIMYAIVNMAVTLISGTPVYSVITWHDS